MSRIHTCTPGHVSYGWIFADTRDREATITLTVTPQHIHASQHPGAMSSALPGPRSVQATATAGSHTAGQRGPAVSAAPGAARLASGASGRAAAARRRGELKAAPRSGVCALGCRAHGRARARRTCGAPACPPGLSKIQTTVNANETVTRPSPRKTRNPAPSHVLGPNRIESAPILACRD